MQVVTQESYYKTMAAGLSPQEQVALRVLYWAIRRRLTHWRLEDNLKQLGENHNYGSLIQSLKDKGLVCSTMIYAGLHSSRNPGYELSDVGRWTYECLRY